MKTSRREFLAASAAIPLAMHSIATAAQVPPRWVLLGTDKGKGIYRAAWNARTGELATPELAIATPRPSYLAMHPKLPVLYSADEAGNGTVSSFHLDRTHGSLSALQQLSSGGEGPCCISVDRSGRAVFVANYTGGSVATFKLAADGGILTPPAVFDCNSSAECGTLGPNKSRQEAPHLHCATLSPDNRFVLVCNLGEDAIEVFPVHPGRASAEILGPLIRVSTRPGSGPRHIAFHPNRRWFYCIHELDCTIDLYDWHVRGDKPVVTLRLDSVISTLAPDKPLEDSTACEILVSDDGRFIYANTRGENSLIVYRVHPTTGLLTEQQRLGSGGTVTRHIVFDPSRRWLLCAHQGSTAITVFAHDPAAGALGDEPRTFAADTPMFIQFV